MWFLSAIVLLAAGSAYGQDPPCALDICFLVDGSSSIGEPSWIAYVIPFLRDIVNGLDNNNIDANVGIQLFSDDVPAPSLQLTNVATDLATILTTINGLPFLTGFTDIATAIRACQDNVLGGINNNPNAQDVIVLISDGVPTKNKAGTIPAASYAKDDHGTHIISVAVGTFSKLILKAISTDDVVIEIDEYPRLINLLQAILDALKAACTPPDPTTTTPSITPPTAPPMCTTKWCNGSMIPQQDNPWSNVGTVELEWFPLSDVDFPDGVDQPPEDLFALEQFVLYFSSYNTYTSYVPPVYPTIP